MAEYIEREATIEKLNKLCDRVCQYSKAQRKYMCGACPLGDAFTVIEDDIPAADVRPVVLCRDCVYAYPYGLEIKCTKHSGRADRFGEDATYSEFHEESWFCADGEEKKHE